MLTASNVGFEIAGRRLLDQVSLSLAPGELLALIGPNGAGKSTLLRLLCGEMVPSSGEVTLEGRRLDALDRLEVARRRAVLPQTTKVVFSFTAREIVEIGRSPHAGRCTREHDRSIADDSMRMMGVERFAGSAFDTMSGGEQQRVHMARVLGQVWDENHEPRYLLLDEPTTSMDLAFQHDTLRIARAFSTRGVGVLAVLHDLNLAAMYADRIAVIHHGRLHGIGRPDEVITEPLLQEVFSLTACVSRHPGMECPLVIPMPAEKVTL